MGLIDTDDLKMAFRTRECAEKFGHSIYRLFFVDKVIDAQPSVDAVPVVHGRWIPTYHTYYNRDGECKIADEWHCSNCGIYSNDEWNYCHNCGAKMDGERKDNEI